jgi:isopentenyl-diphosphate delta-isomerase
MQDNISQFEKRKQDHITLALSAENQTTALNTLDTLHLQHEALPDFDFEDIELKTVRFDQPVPNPFLVSSMTAGHAKAEFINRNLIEACSIQGWCMGVGSQRRELFDDKAGLEWVNLRKEFPKVSLFSNLGIAQVMTSTLAQIQGITDSLQATAIIIHCNPLQEVFQPEGTPQFKGCWAAIKNLVKKLSLPIIIKETGCGFSPSTLARLNEIGVAAVDVSGLGGTHWGRIEGKRCEDPLLYEASKTFANWGIDTVQSIKNAVAINPNFEIWGSGGVRNGLDAAKLLALGASTIGYAKPMLEAALMNSDQVITLMRTLEYELRVAMFCTGSLNLQSLKEKICL